MTEPRASDRPTEMDSRWSSMKLPISDGWICLVPDVDCASLKSDIPAISSQLDDAFNNVCAFGVKGPHF